MNYKRIENTGIGSYGDVEFMKDDERFSIRSKTDNNESLQKQADEIEAKIAENNKDILQVAEEAKRFAAESKVKTVEDPGAEEKK